MKTASTKFFVTAFMLLVISALSFQAIANEKYNQAAEVKQISASGNVHVYITNGETESVKVEGNYDRKDTRITIEDGILNISSTSKEQATILVTVTGLENISAYGKAFIQCLEDLNLDSEDIYLNDTSVALIKTGESELFLSSED